MIEIIILNVTLFITLLVAIPIGVYLTKQSKGIAAFVMCCSGAGLMYFSFWLTDYFRNDSVYHWYYFVTSALLIGAMNEGNTKWGAEIEAQHASTYLFSWAMVCGIVLLFIY